MAEVLIVPTGTANIASVQAAFRRLGAEPVVSEDPEKVRKAGRVMLPGVGAFGSSLRRLLEHGLAAALRERIAADRPTMAICVGHQLLFAESEESPGVTGLGVVASVVGRFPAGVRVPQFGWNLVRPEEGCNLLEEGWAYFANSYRALEAPGWKVATAEHGGPFVAAMERGNVVGCQFHPELSGAYGQALLSRWLELR
ncbi:imidazole glycerol phosphate synthase subunit HisH [Geminicoccaceae bacterium 1502E]|nr:imidazole glycerol phosphate synthase subunit HisH [Geminicoccaceae bacterium 1502E]